MFHCHFGFFIILVLILHDQQGIQQQGFHLTRKVGMLGEYWEQSKNIMISYGTYGMDWTFEITKLLANFQCGLPACYPWSSNRSALTDSAVTERSRCLLQSRSQWPICFVRSNHQWICETESHASLQYLYISLGWKIDCTYTGFSRLVGRPNPKCRVTCLIWNSQNTEAYKI